MKGVARLATVLNTSEALRATDLIIDTFLVVYGQVSEGRSRIAIPEPDQYRSSPESRRAIQKFKTRLANALTALLDTIVDVQSKRTARELGQSLGADAVQNIQDRLRTRGLQNTKLEADTTLVLAQAEQTLAATRKTHAEADSIDIQNLERRIDVVKKLIDMSKHLEPAEFVELMDNFEAEPDRKAISAARRRQEDQRQEIGVTGGPALWSGGAALHSATRHDAIAFSFHSRPGAWGVTRRREALHGHQRILHQVLAPVHELEPVLGRRGGQHVRRVVGREVRGERHGARLRDAGEPHPAGDAADAQQVRHDVVAGAHLDGRLADAPAPPVLADAGWAYRAWSRAAPGCRSRRRRQAPRSRPGRGRRWRGRSPARSPEAAPG